MSFLFTSVTLLSLAQFESLHSLWNDKEILKTKQQPRENQRLAYIPK